ncbi:type II secretion system F family protein [Palleronia caenipelagi]|uniref:Type II secretion system F family protein n=1 Tax=Palleronia caenipelagi TaxID=2489174 RepID=A0A547PUD9_9RHOB|nr:type II secretion system F family protein [Palleronia caenipelagi]TRD17755.1 type II secretion system F family protein [Palleronia caenipelagi]
MTELVPIVAGLAGFMISTGVLMILWHPTREFIEALTEAVRYHDPLQAVVVAGGGGRRPDADSGNWRVGLTNRPHDQLNLSERQYARGLAVAGSLSGLAMAAILVIVMQSWVAILVGFIAVISFRFLFEFAIQDQLRSNHLEQLRQFPFFLDIFQLTVQAGGDLDDAITSYRAIYGNDPIGRELAILQESHTAFGIAESLDRLRNRVGNVDLKNVVGELAQKIRVGANLEQTLAQQSEDMRDLREELAAKRAEELNAKFNWPVVLATVATFLIFLSPAIALIFDSGFL